MRLRCQYRCTHRGAGVLEQNTYCEYPAVANGADHHGFAVMVHLKAPALVTAAPLDLVAKVFIIGNKNLSEVMDK